MDNFPHSKTVTFSGRKKLWRPKAIKFNEPISTLSSGDVPYPDSSSQSPIDLSEEPKLCLQFLGPLIETPEDFTPSAATV